ncbi:hypothetical protein PAXRUDRAFT_512687 [Paxillus rubicundulus Ve08.2h10]|uniref:Uncharacterized protein n=1 Tax=Paxillus rubicundulus Ve08.2h10 TaxID=930991 RepID=A0A0D0DW77_9AGAM|nr:hypothetical protein PAXRUDRAFT_512687 [Paxillus rubicundulus Ve08.2h10]
MCQLWHQHYHLHCCQFLPLLLLLIFHVVSQHQLPVIVGLLVPLLSFYAGCIVHLSLLAQISVCPCIQELLYVASCPILFVSHLSIDGIWNPIGHPPQISKGRIGVSNTIQWFHQQIFVPQMGFVDFPQILDLHPQSWP